MTYLLFVVHALSVVCLVFGPAFFWSFVRGRPPVIDAFSPMPGILLLSVFGLLLWLTPEAATVYIKLGFMALYAVMTGISIFALAVRWGGTFGEYGPAYLVTSLVLVQAVAIGVTPLPIPQEYNWGTPQPGRMIASPPDNTIPFTTADYLRHRFNGRENSEQYFGPWGVAARGPIVPLGINALFSIFGYTSEAPASENQWPMSAHGEHLASIFGWLLNALVLLGVFQVTKSITRERSALLIALTWAALSPVVLVNTVFTWPKLLATYFLLLSIASINEKRMARSGALAALSWLSHPVGALMLPALGLFTISAGGGQQVNLVAAFKRCTPAAAAGLAIMLPWVSFKIWVGGQDPFASYLLGSGQGFQQAQTFSEWVRPRITNIEYTLVPFKFYFDGLLGSWIYGPLGDFPRWLTQYAKSLPGQLGFSAFLVAYVSFFFRKRFDLESRFLWCLIVGAFTTMIVFWGFSGDGLGRNCLEPLTLLVIVFASVYGKITRQLAPYFLSFVSAENIFLSLGNFVSHEGFSIDVLTASSLISLAIASAMPLVILATFFWLHEKPDYSVFRREESLAA